MRFTSSAVARVLIVFVSFLQFASIAHAEKAWVRQAPIFICNGQERKPERAQVSDTTFSNTDGAGKTNTISWSLPKAVLKDGDLVELTITSSKGDGAPILGSWRASDAGEQGSDVKGDGAAASWPGGKRGDDFANGKISWTFKAASRPEFRVQVGRFDDVSGEMTVAVVWKYVFEEAGNVTQEQAGELGVELTVMPTVYRPGEAIQGVVKITSKNLDPAKGEIRIRTNVADDATVKNLSKLMGNSRESALVWDAFANAQLGLVRDPRLPSHEIPLDAFRASTGIESTIKELAEPLKVPNEEGTYVICTVAIHKSAKTGVLDSKTVRVVKSPRRILITEAQVSPMSGTVGDRFAIDLKAVVDGMKDANEAVDLSVTGEITGPMPIAIPADKPKLSTAPEEGEAAGTLFGHARTSFMTAPVTTPGDYVWKFKVSAPGFEAAEGSQSFKVDAARTGDGKGVVQGDATVELVGGTASVQKADGSWTEITGKTKLAPGLRVATGPGGRIKITFPDGAYVDVLPRTNLWINTGGNVVMEAGNIGDIISSPDGKSPVHLLFTPVAGFEPDGTRYNVAHDVKTKTTTIKVTEGAVKVTPKRTGTKPFRVVAGQMAQVSPAGATDPGQGVGGGGAGGGGGGAQYVKTTKDTFAVNEAIVVNYDDANGHQFDWVLLAKPEETFTAMGVNIDESNKFSQRAGTDRKGTRMFPGLAEGQYEARYMSWSGGNNKIVGRHAFSVGKAPVVPPRDPGTDGGGGGGGPKVTERTVNLEVPANKAWTPTGVTLDAKTFVRIEATGQVEAAGAADKRIFYHQVPPEGRDEFHPNMPHPLIRAVSMIGKVGEGPALPVGKHVQYLHGGAPYGSGELMLGINDDRLDDNSGVWNVKLIIFTRTETTGGTGQFMRIKEPHDNTVHPEGRDAVGPTTKPGAGTSSPGADAGKIGETTAGKPGDTMAGKTGGTTAGIGKPTDNTKPPLKKGDGDTWVCAGAEVTNGRGEKTWRPDFKATETSMTFEPEVGGKKIGNTITWTAPPLTLRAGDEVELTMTSTNTPGGPYVGGNFHVHTGGDAAKVVGENGASSNPNWRANSPHSGTLRFVFTPDTTSSSPPAIRVTAANAGADGGPSSSVVVTWIYKKQ